MADNRIIRKCASGEPLRFWINYTMDVNHGVDVHIFTAPRACKVTKVRMIASTIDTSGTAPTVAMTRAQGVEAPSAGDVIVAAIDTTAAGLTDNTVLECTVITTGGINELSAGNRVSLNWTNATTDLVGMITVEMELL